MASGSGDLEEVSLAMNKVSIQVVEDGGAVKKVDRHCSFCLTLVPGAEVKLCSKCKRRAYCSKECQVADWKLSKKGPAFNGKIYGYGQGHKNWCGLPYGEEDLDWKVAPISGKGLGLVALRDLPPLYRILVEGMQPEPVLGNDGRYKPYHPGVDDLTSFPLSTTDPAVKFDMNYQKTNLGHKVGLRISRANHSCEPNASCRDDDEFHVLILYSNREIKEGEEICIAYALANRDICCIEKDVYGNSVSLSPEALRHFLAMKWGIVCPLSCPCLDKEKVKLVKNAKKLFEECERDYRRTNVVKKMEKVLEAAGELGCSPGTMSRLHFFASEYAFKNEGTRKKGKEYLELFLAFNHAIYHPSNKGMIQEGGDCLWLSPKCRAVEEMEESLYALVNNHV